MNRYNNVLLNIYKIDGKNTLVRVIEWDIWNNML
jgi:hypothetical protein